MDEWEPTDEMPIEDEPIRVDPVNFYWIQIIEVEGEPVIQGMEKVALSSDLKTAFAEHRAIGTPFHVCLRGASVNSAIESSEFLLPKLSRDDLVRLAVDALPGWESALTHRASEDIQVHLLQGILEAYAKGEITRVLETLDPEKAWPNVRIVDLAAWKSKRKPFGVGRGVWTLDVRGEQFITEGLADEPRMGFLAFRCVRLAVPASRPTMLCYRTTLFEYESDKFRNWAEKLFISAQFLLTDKIVQRICTFHKELFDRLLAYLEDSEISKTIDIAHRHILDSLRNYTHQVTRDPSEQPQCPEFLQKLKDAGELSPQGIRELADLTVDEKFRVSALDGITSRVPFKQKDDFHSFILPLIKRRGLVPIRSDTALLATFNFSLHKEIASTELAALPVAGGISFPALRTKDVVPVLLRRVVPNHGQDQQADRQSCKLHSSFRRHVVLSARVDWFDLQLSTEESPRKFALATWDHNLSELEARSAMDLVAHRRLPLHERRLLHLLHIPCREALEDMEADGLRQLVDEAKPQDGFFTGDWYDKALLANIDIILDLRKELWAATSQEEVVKVLVKFGFTENSYISSDSSYAAIEVLSRLLEFAHVEHPAIRNWLDAQRLAFRGSGNRLLELIVEWAQILLQQGVKELQSRDLAKDLRTRIWLELQAAFPDGAHWPQAEFSVDGKPLKLSIYALSVVNSLFHRPQLLLHEKPLALPSREWRIAAQSTLRIHRLASVLPVCCGDWANADYYKDPGRMKRVSESRVFGSVNPASGRQADFSNVVLADSEIHSPDSFCLKSICQHAPYTAMSSGAIFSKISTISGKVKEVSEALTRGGFWLNTLIDEGAHHHFRCRGCGHLLIPDPNSSWPYIFSCPRKPSPGDLVAHDKGVYLNWCFGSGCTAIIDSRGCKKCSHDRYICNNCHSCCKDDQEIAPADGPPACVRCRRKLGSTGLNKVDGANHSIVSCICGAENHIYPRGTAPEDVDEHAALWPSESGKGLRYNTRP